MWEYNTNYKDNNNEPALPPRWAVWTLTLHGQHECSAHYHGETLAIVDRDRMLGEGRCAWIVDTWKEA